MLVYAGGGTVSAKYSGRQISGKRLIFSPRRLKRHRTGKREVKSKK